ncbi:MAG: circularly permuted type 2 ATP-grasp protein [Cytophagales bacterium]|nr:circularly permuted type 2 ATP-grasp protein [Cytophagales bacterium]
MSSEYIHNHFAEYAMESHFLDEVFDKNKKVQPHYEHIIKYFNEISLPDFKNINEYSKMTFYNQGITFAVYSDKERGVERIFPFDLIPRIIPNSEWNMLEKGVIQRNIAINMFLWDVYHDRKIIQDKIVPESLLATSPNYFKQMMGVNPIGKIYTHVSGTDLIKHKDGKYYVLEDNVRVPSGVSYVLSNRDAIKKTFPNLLLKHNVCSVQEYPIELLKVMKSVAPESANDPECVVLTPGVYNSAYFEHSFLALNMGIPLVEGRDLFVEKNFVYMKTLYGPKRVDVIYRRIDDLYIDPLAFNPDSVLGIPGIMKAYTEGNVTLLNAPGTGAADDKAIYTYVPDMIKYYLAEEPILNNVHTYRCELDADLKYVMENMEQLVIKPVDESGGYGILVGSKANKEEMENYKIKIKANPRKYIAQPIMSLSVHSTYIEEADTFEQRHIDLRTYCLMGKNKQYLLKGGLTRVALKRGSLIVNSSQGGGSKDTWVMHE